MRGSVSWAKPHIVQYADLSYRTVNCTVYGYSHISYGEYRGIGHMVWVMLLGRSVITACTISPLPPLGSMLGGLSYCFAVLLGSSGTSSFIEVC